MRLSHTGFIRIAHGKPCGFTLAELLIALAILGIIATFTIPKVLTSQTNTKYKAIGKEVAGMLSGAYEAYKQQNTPNASTSIGHLTPYMNYVAVDTSGTIDRGYNDTTSDCSVLNCLRLHNGAKVMYVAVDGFGNTAATNALYFYVDPDGVSDANTTGPAKSVVLWLYYNGRLVNWGSLEPNTYSGGGNYGPDPSRDPPWFSWN